MAAGFASQEQAEAMLAASAATTATHDHLLSPPSTGSLDHSSAALAFSSVPPPSATQELWGVSPSHSCAADPTVAQRSPFQPQEPVLSPVRGDQSAPCPPTTRQLRREKRAAFVAASEEQLGGGVSRDEPSAEGKKERQKEYCFVLTRTTSREERTGDALPPLPRSLARQLAFDGAPNAAAAAGTAPAAAADKHGMARD